MLRCTVYHERRRCRSRPAATDRRALPRVRGRRPDRRGPGGRPRALRAARRRAQVVPDRRSIGKKGRLATRVQVLARDWSARARWRAPASHETTTIGLRSQRVQRAAAGARESLVRPTTAGDVRVKRAGAAGETDGQGRDGRPRGASRAAMPRANGRAARPSARALKREETRCCTPTEAARDDLKPSRRGARRASTARRRRRGERRRRQPDARGRRRPRMAPARRACSTRCPPRCRRTRRRACARLRAREGWRPARHRRRRVRASPHMSPTRSNRCFYCKRSLYARRSRAHRRADRLGRQHATTSPTTGPGSMPPPRPVCATLRRSRHRQGARCARVAPRARPGRLAELPASPCLSSRVETGIRIERADAAAHRRGRERGAPLVAGARRVRCRVRAGGVVIEIDARGLERIDAARRAPRAARGGHVADGGATRRSLRALSHGQRVRAGTR